MLIEHLNDRPLTVLLGEVARGSPIVVSCVEIGTSIEQQIERIAVTLARRDHRRGDPARTAGIQIGSCAE